VRKWRRRWSRQVFGLQDLPRPVFLPKLVAIVKSVACELPAQHDQPTSRLFLPDIRPIVMAEKHVEAISCSTICRILDADALKPWRGGSRTARRTRVRPGRGLSLPCRPGCASRQGHGPRRTQHLHCPLPSPGATGHDPRALRFGPASVLDRGPKEFSSAYDVSRPAATAVSQQRRRGSARSCQLAQPDRDLLLDSREEGAYAERLSRSRGGGRAHSRVREALHAKRRAVPMALHPSGLARAPEKDAGGCSESAGRRSSCCGAAARRRSIPIPAATRVMLLY